MESYEAYRRRRLKRANEPENPDDLVRPKTAEEIGAEEQPKSRKRARLPELDQPTPKPDPAPTVAPRRAPRPVAPVQKTAEPEPQPAYVTKQEDVVTPSPAPIVADPPAPKRAAPPSLGAWQDLNRVDLNTAHLEKQRIISALRKDPSHVAFDILRTRLLAALHDNGWNRVAITSPTKDCGKTFVATNLAISLSRQSQCKTVLMDMDLRGPSLAKVLGVENPGNMADFLTGDVGVSGHFCVAAPNDMHIGDNLAFGLNKRPESYAAELLLGPQTRDSLKAVEEELHPDVMLFDLPPALAQDDVIAFRPQFDGVLLVVGGGITKPAEIHEVKRRLGEDTPLLGVIMNKAEGLNISEYTY